MYRCKATREIREWRCYINAQASRVASDIEGSNDNPLPIDRSARDRLAVVKTRSKLMFVVFTQLVSLTSGTSSGLAKVISTH